MAKKPVVLIIRDGWGLNPGGKETAEKDGNAVLLANTPFHDEVLSSYPRGHLSASGMDVGLPDGQMGNSEVGHLNLGAGRIVYQDLTRINKAIAEGTLADNPVFKETMEKAKGSRLHFIGLVSDGGVHSHQDQLIAMVKLAGDNMTVAWLYNTALRMLRQVPFLAEAYYADSAALRRHNLAIIQALVATRESRGELWEELNRILVEMDHGIVERFETLLQTIRDSEDGDTG